MRVISRKRLTEFARKHPDARTALDTWFRTVKAARWASIADVRRVYPHADAVTVESGKTVTVFNVRGNDYRLVTALHYNTGRVYVLRALTHAEYDKDAWKDQL
jgi:mRNA interferase HigB